MIEDTIYACKEDIDDKCRVSCERRGLHKKRIGMDTTLVDIHLSN